MKKFKFSLEDILSFRQFEQQQAEFELGKALAAEQQLQAKLDAVASRKADVQKYSAGSLDFTEIASAYRFCDFSRAKSELLKGMMANAQRVSDEKRELLRCAMRKTDALKRLKEEQEETYYADVIREEDNFIDDMVAGRYKR